MFSVVFLHEMTVFIERISNSVKKCFVAHNLFCFQKRSLQNMFVESAS